MQSDVTPDSRLQDEFELWNEPTLAPASYEPYAKLAAVTCVAIHTSRRAVGASPPAMFYGALSGGYASGAGVAFVNGSLPLLARMLASGGSGLTLADCVSAVTYHACECLGRQKKTGKKTAPHVRIARDVFVDSQMGSARRHPSTPAHPSFGSLAHATPATPPRSITDTAGPPENTHARTLTDCDMAPSPCSAVERLGATVSALVPTAYLFQGETGAPARWQVR